MPTSRTWLHGVTLPSIGFDPGFAAQVAAGNLPVALTNPAISPIPPVPALGGISFTIDLDADDDGLLDGEEPALGLDPDDADSDNDGLDDGDEVNVHGTDPLDPDTDDDGLDDGIEVTYGTDPLDADSDDDGIPDGQDVEFIQNALNGLPDEAFHSGGNANAMLRRLESIELSTAMGKNDVALQKLTNMRARVDGCGISPDNDDWIVDCAAQNDIRDLIDLLIGNLS